MVVRGAITLGEFVAFGAYLAMLHWPMIALGWVVNIFERGEASMGRIDEILRRAGRDRRRSAPARARAIRGDVEFRDLTFAYDGAPRAARREPGRARRDHRRHRGAHRLGQEHAREPHPPALRGAARHRARGRARREDHPAPRPAGRGGSRAAGDASCSPTPWARTWPSACRAASPNRSAAARRPRPPSPSWPRTSGTSPWGTRPSWASAASRSAAARSSARRWPGPWPSTRAS